ncbi:hypothetical protein WA1_01980 [Scytonema hofmannii PCC 7110]|uniref:Uncharacterized protein n=1 Tax=Scytonema hofmannii PCC 7110 TaxID=128403 RepID=A0A139XGX2_9CYAN|nr:hypothetical protein [Scytonema hofmannii]KYC43940.1 hypothetical protein WA1_01980 [Scytonema hofmannii PCC 7110]
MAWEEFERNGVKGITGDQPIDELAIALTEIASSYEDRFSRKPTIIEIMWAMETVLSSNPKSYVSDPEGLKYGDIIVKRDYEAESDDVDLTEYEASAGIDPPGYIFVSRRGSSQKNLPPIDVIKITILDLRERNLVCEYEILTKDISDQMAQTLILSVVLDEFYDRYFHDKADNIDFINAKSHTQSTVSYASL